MCHDDIKNFKKGIYMKKFCLYTTGCPKCRILEKKLTDKNVEYEVICDPEKIKAKGNAVPMLESIDDDSNKVLNYYEAVKFVNSL